MSDRQEKRGKFEEGGKRSLRPMVIFVLLIAALALGGWFALGEKGGVRLVTASEGRVAIDVATVDDGKAHFFRFASKNGEVEFFILKSGDGTLRAAFDACDVCYHAKKGYRQEGDFMVCNNCDMKFSSGMINEVKGGCNPTPLLRSLKGEKLVIAASDLADGARYFEAGAGN